MPIASIAGAWYTRATRSKFSRNVLWVTGLSGAERFIALIQTVLLARTLGIAEYGAYGLLVGTAMFVASLAGMQMGLTATVHVARFLGHEKAKVAHVIQYVTWFAYFCALLLLCLTVPFAKQLSIWLFASQQYTWAVVLGCALVAGWIIGGAQDGVLQGFEDFRTPAATRILTSILALALIYPAASFYGLAGVTGVLFASLVLKYLILRRMVARHRRNHDIPAKGAGIALSELIFRFSTPTMLVSLMIGAVTWFGTFLLSRQSGGFEAVAIVNIGLQWRGPVLLLAGSIASVSVPVFSRLAGSDDTAGLDRMARRLLWANGLGATGVSLAVVLASPFILATYGEKFPSGQLVFALQVLTGVPQVMANVFMQQLMGSGRVWLQFWLHLPYVVLLALGFLVFIPGSLGTGYAWVLFIGSVGFLAVARAVCGAKN